MRIEFDQENSDEGITEMPIQVAYKSEVNAYHGPLYRFLSLNDKDREDLEYLGDLEKSGNKNAAKTYLDIVGYKKDHRLAYLFRNFKLFRTTPLGFNDPYDCLVEIDPNASEEHLLHWFRYYRMLQSYDSEQWIDTVNNIKPDLTEYLNDNTKAFNSTHHREVITSLIKKTLQKFVNQSRLICFSAIPDNILMWAHYADKHEGYCLEFSAENLKTNRSIGFYKVKYLDLRPLINFSHEEWLNHDFSRKILMVKSNFWRYEEEIRMIKTGKEEYFDFKPSALKKIIFGYAMPDSHKKGFKFLIHILNENDSLSHFKFIPAEIDPLHFKVIVPE